MSDFSLKDAIVLVTGAGRGIGLAVSRRLAEKGAKVVLTSRTQEDLEQACTAIQAAGGSAIAFSCDIRREDEVKSLFQKVRERYGRIDILINNAGVLTYGPVVSVSLEDWDRVIDTNLKGVFLCSREVLPLMLEQGTGRIINIASGAGETGFPNLAVYCASKFGLIGFSKALAQEVQRQNIQVSYLCPGYVATRMLELFPEEVINNISPVRPEEVADQILQLIFEPDLPDRKSGFFKSALKKGVQWMTSKKSD